MILHLSTVTCADVLTYSMFLFCGVAFHTKVLSNKTALHIGKAALKMEFLEKFSAVVCNITKLAL